MNARDNVIKLHNNISISKAIKGTKREPHTKETKEKMSKALMGKKRGPHTKETKEKMSKARGAAQRFRRLTLARPHPRVGCRHGDRLEM